jgi:threonine dehydratase
MNVRHVPPAAPPAVTRADVAAARERLRGAVLETPCVRSPALSAITGADVFLKLEYLQRTGSFKERGACNALLALAGDARQRGVIAASAGNHALALAHHGQRLGIPVTVVMPRFSPLIKQARCRAAGAEVRLFGDDIADAREEADRLSVARGLEYIHGFDAPAVIAGQGTVGLEVLDQVPDADAVVCPIGGAGLIAGIAVTLEGHESIELIGVEPARAASFRAAIAAGAPVRVRVTPTLADGLAVPTVGPNAFALARHRVSRVVTVEEPALALAVLRLAELEKGVVEGAGAAPLAAFLEGHLGDLAGRRVVLLLCGGNIDPAVLSRVIEMGLVADGRLAKFVAVISDRPGGLAEFTATVAATGASIKQVEHDRAFGSSDVSRVQVLCTVEARDSGHLAEVFAGLADAGIDIVRR